MTAGRACFAVVEPLRGSAGSPAGFGDWIGVVKMQPI